MKYFLSSCKLLRSAGEAVAGCFFPGATYTIWVPVILVVCGDWFLSSYDENIVMWPVWDYFLSSDNKETVSLFIK